ncbi:HWE histidine kinase domain-containing protein [Mesorhizobium sp. A623]
MSDPVKGSGHHAGPSNEAEETLRAIREGEVDALVIRRAMTEEVFSLQGWDDSYRAFMETMDHGAAALGAHSEVLYANTVFCQFLGKPLSACQGESLLDVLPGTVRPTIGDLLEDARTEKQTAEISLENEGEKQFFLVSAAPFNTGVVSGFALTLTDLTDRVRAEKSSASERAARAIIASANEAVVVCDNDGRITHVNAAMLAIREGELIGELFGEAVKLTFPAVSGIANSDDLISTVVNGGTLQGIEAHAPDAPRVKDVLISAAPLTHEGEAINGCVITLVDLSQRKVTEKQQLLMMGELDHRVKNTLALVLSISNRTLSKEDTLEGFHKSFSGRIQSLAATHNLLADKAWTNLTVADVVKTELAPFVSLDNSRVQLEQLGIGITPRAAIALGMTIHELATNAVKYGVLSTETGKLCLHAQRDTESLKLDWIESGGPPVKEPQRKGFGRTVIGRSLQYSPNGGADLDFHPEGVRCSIRIPIEDVVELRKHR